MFRRFFAAFTQECVTQVNLTGRWNVYPSGLSKCSSFSGRPEAVWLPAYLAGGLLGLSPATLHGFPPLQIGFAVPLFRAIGHDGSEQGHAGILVSSSYFSMTKRVPIGC